MNFSALARNRWVQTAAISAVSSAVSATVGYFIGARRNKEYNRVIGFINEVKETSPELQYAGRIIDKEAYDNVAQAPYAYDRPLSFDGPTSFEDGESVRIVPKAETTDSPEDPIPVNVFKNDEVEWDWEHERQNRKSTEPYILHHEEYFADEMGFTQSTVTYYEGDDILADESDQIQENHAGLLGELMFGHGTTDPNVVYIRNERVEHEWEVVRHTGYFHVEVLGHQMEAKTDRDRNHLQHSVMKFRDRG